MLAPLFLSVVFEKELLQFFSYTHEASAVLAGNHLVASDRNLRPLDCVSSVLVMFEPLKII